MTDAMVDGGTSCSIVSANMAKILGLTPVPLAKVMQLSHLGSGMSFATISSYIHLAVWIPRHYTPQTESNMTLESKSMTGTMAHAYLSWSLTAASTMWYLE
jgi:hypothetical protein